MIGLNPMNELVTYYRVWENIVCEQGCQLSDFSLRSQTFCHTVDFSTTFSHMLKTKTFLHIPSQNHQQAPSPRI